MALTYRQRERRDGRAMQEDRIEPRLGPAPHGARSDVFDTGRKTIIDCDHVRVERLDTRPVLFSKVFKEFEDARGRRYDYRYWAERENFFLREFLKKQSDFTHVVQPRHLISENEAAKQVLTCDAGITIADWLRVKSRYADTATLSHPFQRADVFLRLVRACLVALKEIHEHRIVHCDIKEDNICIPYAPSPLPEDGTIRLEFEKLKLIDFAFSIAHAIPLTQILVIDPAERLPYQSELLVSALLADRRSGCPNAVQQLDYRVDLFSLGYLAEKICAPGLLSPRAAGGSRVPDGIAALVRKLKAYDGAPAAGPAPSPAASALPHDALIAETDRLLAATGVGAPLEFTVEGEWTAEEMAQGRGAGRKTPMTPVALTLPTPVSVPPAPAPRRRPLRAVGATLLYAAAPFAAAAAVFLYLGGGMEGPRWLLRAWDRIVAAAPAERPLASTAAPASDPVPSKQDAATGIGSLLRSDDDAVFREASRTLGRLMASDPPAALATAESIATEYGAALAERGSRAARSRALARLTWLARTGNTFAARRLTAFEKNYDAAKEKMARSAWWTRGQGPQPEGAARWLEDGALLAENGDRPAMLDRAFAMGYGRALEQDRAGAVETYLEVMARAEGSDATATRIRQSAARGLMAVLNAIVEQKDRDAGRRVLSALESKADSAAAAGVHYYLGLMNECVAQPANLEAARQWYRKAAADPAWKRTADDKARVIGAWCPGAT